MVIDEAAAIPINQVRPMLNSKRVFISSTIHGYEGTGRSLSLKLIEKIRKTQKSTLRETTMEIPIRYSIEDPVEEWLSNLLCLDTTLTQPLKSILPHPDNTQLYLINKETLFSYNKSSELFLRKIWSLFVSSHYKNSPNDL